jgi:hypothetical protein
MVAQLAAYQEGLSSMKLVQLLSADYLRALYMASKV